MTVLGRRLRERMLFQWGVAYLAGAWLLLQVLDLLGGTFSWPQVVQQIATILLGVGFLATLVLAWYHGERGQQRVAAMELAIFAVLCVIAAVGVALVGGGGRERPTTPPQGEAAAPAPAERRSIAVLPFVNMSGSHENEYFSDGITEEILNALARVPGLKVAGRTSSFAFKGRNEDLSLIGRKLRVAALLEGSVQRAGNRVRITAQLIDASTGYHLWSGRFDRELKDIFALEDEIARTITDTLRIALAPGMALAHRATTSPEAYDLYLQGRFAQRRSHQVGGTEQDALRAVELFNRAIALDSAYARAYAGLADTYSQFLADAYWAPARAYPKAREAAERALQIDPTLSEAWVSLALVKLWHQWDYPAAIADLRRAVSADPRNATAHGYLGRALAQAGRGEEAIVTLDRARDLSGDYRLQFSRLVAQRALGRIATVADSLDAAIDPRSADRDDIVYRLSADYLAGRFEVFLRVDSIATDRLGSSPLPGFGPSLRAAAWARTGRTDRARAYLDRLAADSRRRYVASEHFAVVYAALGEKAKALEHLERAARVRSGNIPDMVPWDPSFDVLRGEPRFQAITAQIRMP